jgi:hypothetical protein
MLYMQILILLFFSVTSTDIVLFFPFQRPDIGRRLANMPVESYVAVRGWVYPRPPGQRNVVNIVRIVPVFHAQNLAVFVIYMLCIFY